jgi:hypothetical protein
VKSSTVKAALALSVLALGIAVCAGAIYIGEMDDAPGASLAGILLMIASVVFAVKIARRKR